MNEHQQTALRYHGRLAVEAVHPRFRYQQGMHSIVLTVNSGWE